MWVVQESEESIQTPSSLKEVTLSIVPVVVVSRGRLVWAIADKDHFFGFRGTRVV